MSNNDHVNIYLQEVRNYIDWAMMKDSLYKQSALENAARAFLDLDEELSNGAPLPTDWDGPIKRCSETFCGSTDAKYYDEVEDAYYCYDHAGALSGELKRP